MKAYFLLGLIQAEEIHENLQGPTDLRDSPICHDKERDDFQGGLFPKDFIHGLNKWNGRIFKIIF